MHPLENIRGIEGAHLEGKRIVLAVSGSIAAVKTVELARELARHGAQVHAVMTHAATRIIHPDALQFATGNPVITKLTGNVEHVALLGEVADRADLLLLAPATANTVSKLALGIDDSTVTTCATVAVGTKVPIVIAPAMHEAMLKHPVVQKHVAELQDRFKVTWVEPNIEEKKAKLADISAIVEAVIGRLAQKSGPLAGKHCLVIGGATAERIDDVRILTNRSSGQSAIALARSLRRLGASVNLWYGFATTPLPAEFEDAVRFEGYRDLHQLASALADGAFDQVWLPAAIADYVPEKTGGKIPSGQTGLSIPLLPTGKIAAVVRKVMPNSTMILFKAETDAEKLVPAARKRMEEHKAQFVVANTVDSFASASTTAQLVTGDSVEEFSGTKARVMDDIARRVASSQ